MNERIQTSTRKQTGKRKLLSMLLSFMLVVSAAICAVPVKAVTQSDPVFTSGQRIYLDGTYFSGNWQYPYMYFFDDSVTPHVKTWVKMYSVNDGSNNNNLFYGYVPCYGVDYRGLIFTNQRSDTGDWSYCTAQTVDITWDGTSNLYYFADTNSSGKYYGNWTTYQPPEILPETVDGAYKISTDAFGGTLTVESEGKTAGTADENDTVIVTAGLPEGYSLDSISVKGKSKTTYQTEALGNNQYSFTMPAENVTVSAKFVYDKSTAFTGNVFWVDTQPSVTNSPMGIVMWSSYYMGSTSGTYYLYLPGGTDLSNLHVYYGNGAPVIDGVTLEQGQSYSFVEDQSYTVNGRQMRVLKSDSASIYLQTETALRQTAYGSNTVIDKELTRQTNGQFMSVNADGQVVDKPQVLAQIKGRGNSSWEASCKYFGKYAYNIKLDKKADVLNMGAVKSKSFCLLANNMDESLLRNLEIFKAAALAGLGYVPHCEVADLYNNGNYIGSYLITEKVDVGGSKLVQGETVEDYHNDETASNIIRTASYNYQGKSCTYQYVDTGAVDDGVDYTKKSYLLEFDLQARATAERCWFFTPKGQYIAVKSPEDLNREEMLFIMNKWFDAEAAVYNNDYSSMEAQLDLASFADVYLIQEFTKNLDSCASSYYVYYDGTQDNPKWQATPIWDYDWTLGGYQNTSKKINSNGASEANNRLDDYTGWFAKYKCIIVSDSNQLNTWNFQAQLCNNSTFWNEQVVKAWNSHMYSALSDVFSSKIDQDFQAHDGSFAMNEARYGFLSWHPITSWGSVNTGSTPQVTYQYLREWANNRLSWMHNRLSVPFSGVKLSLEKTTVLYGDTITLTAEPYPDYTADLTYTFTRCGVVGYPIGETTEKTITVYTNDISLNYTGVDYLSVTATDNNSNTYTSDPVPLTILYTYPAHEATCTASGNIEAYIDQNTGKTYIIENGEFKEITDDEFHIPATGHDYTEEVKHYENSEECYILHTCSKCGDQYSSECPYAQKHRFTTRHVDATCTEYGHTIHSCQQCDYSYSVIDYSDSPTGHDYSTQPKWSWTQVNGYYTASVKFVCSKCGDCYSEYASTSSSMTDGIITYKAEYYDQHNNKYTSAMVVHASYSFVVDGGIITDGEKTSYSYADPVTVKAYDKQDGTYFSGWYIGDTRITTKKSYTFYVKSDMTVTAKYENDTAMEQQTDLSILIDRENIANNKQKVQLTVRWALPNGCTLKEAGLVRRYDSTEGLTLANVDGSNIKNNKSTLRNQNGTYTYIFNVSASTKLRSINAKAYLIYTDKNGSTQTVYTDVQTSVYNG